MSNFSSACLLSSFYCGPCLVACLLSQTKTLPNVFCLYILPDITLLSDLIHAFCNVTELHGGDQPTLIPYGLLLYFNVPLLFPYDVLIFLSGSTQTQLGQQRHGRCGQAKISEEWH